MSNWSFEPIADNAAVVALILVGLVLALSIRPRFGTVGTGRNALLTLLRLLTIVIVGFMLLRPTRISTTTEPRIAKLLVLFDRSRSMQLPDRSGGVSRWESQKLALEKIYESWPELAKTTEVRWYEYDRTLRELELKPNEKLSLEGSPTGEQTDIGVSLEEALRRESGKRLAGVLLLGDGTQTQLQTTAESAAVARQLNDEFGAPLFTTVFGPAGDAAQAKDVAVDRLDEQYLVFVKNEAVIRGRVKIAGFVNQPIPLQLQLFDANGKQVESLEQKKVARTDGESVEFEFPYTPQTAGHFKLTVSAKEQPGELVTKNNALSAYLTVLEGGLRVLFIDSGKRAEYKFLKRSLHESPDIELDEFLIDSLNRKTWPVNLAPLLKENKYDVFLLGNIPANAWSEESQQLLTKAVEQGQGLLCIGGVRTFGAGNYYGSPLAEALPIVFDRFEKQDFDSPDRGDLFLPGPITLTPTSSHVVTRFVEGVENEKAWQRLPPLDFANRFSSLKTSPGVRVLLQGAKQEPLLVSNEYGSGRVLTFAGESTFHWVLQGQAVQHKRFWRQAILWLARRDETQQSDVWLKLAQRRFQPGANVAFNVGARSPEGELISNAQFNVALIFPDGKSQSIRVTPGKEHASGAFTAKEPGDYALEVTATHEGRTLGKSRAEFFVFDQDVEMSNPVADHEHFARLSLATKDFGGRPVPVEELSQLLSELAHRPADEEEHQIKWRFGDEPWSAWLCLSLLACLLGSEWWLRKKWGLV
jgi:uncharacterized membrane protein